MNKVLGAAAAAFAASGAAFAQPGLELFAPTDAQVELVQQITELRAEGGPTRGGRNRSVARPGRAVPRSRQ